MQQLNILHISDQDRLELEEGLHSHFVHHVAAIDAPAASEARPYDVVIVDLPGAQALQVLQELPHKTAGPRVIVVAQDGDPGVAQQIVRLHAIRLTERDLTGVAELITYLQGSSPGPAIPAAPRVRLEPIHGNLEFPPEPLAHAREVS